MQDHPGISLRNALLLVMVTDIEGVLSLARVTSSDKPGTPDHVLVLGMVRLNPEAFETEMQTQLTSNREAHGPLRDEIRMREFERLTGYVIHTVSEMLPRHSNYFPNTHIQATISDSSSRSRGLSGILGNYLERPNGSSPFFKAMFVDWIRMPGPYARQICDTKFFSKILVDLVRDKWIGEGTPLYLPTTISGELEQAQRELAPKGYSLCVRDIKSQENSLWEATNLAVTELEKIGDPNRSRDQMFQCVTLLSSGIRSRELGFMYML